MRFGEDIWDKEKFHGMEAPLAGVHLSDDKSEICFEFQDGTSARFEVEGDCCSQSWIEHLEMPNDIVGQCITEIFEEAGDTKPGEDLSQFDVLAVYQTHFRTPVGDIVLEYRNDSNGYYGGYLVRLSEKKKVM